MAWYKTGTVTVTLGQTSVTGAGTKFASNARVGDGFTGPDGRWYEVVNIASETVIGIFPAYIGETTTNSASYTIAPLQGYNKETADRLRKITDGIDSVDGDVAEAKDAAAQAAASAAAANTSKTQAATSATAAAGSAAASAASSTDATAAKSAAETARTGAQAAQTAAESAKTDAQASQTAAGTSATNAASSASAALASQNAAKTSETNAKTSETNSKASETNAKASEAAATASQTAASTSATNAGASATAAQTARTGAETARTGSESAKAAAETARSGAQTAETNAKDWASKPEDSVVASGLYSALHYAAKAKESADSAAGTVGPRLNSIAQAVMAVNDLLIANTTTTMTSLATGATGRELIGAGTPVAGRTALALGTAATANVTTSNLDTTANRIMRVGDFGLGSLSTAISIEQVNSNSCPSGMYRLDNPSLSNELPTGAYSLLAISLNNVGSTHQRAISHTSGVVYERSTVAAPWRIMDPQSFGLGIRSNVAGNILTDFNQKPLTGLYRGTFATATGGPADAPTTSGFTCLFMAYNNGSGIYHLTTAGPNWIGYLNGGTVAWTKTLNTGDFGVGDHMKFTANAPVGTAMSNFTGNGFFACAEQVPSDWKSDGGGGTYPLGFTVQSTTALGLQVAAGNGSNALHYRVRGPSSFLDWRKIYDNSNIIGTVSQNGGAPTGAVFEKGTNTNGTYTKFADGTMICRMYATTPATAFTALGSMYVSAAITVPFPATFISGADVVIHGNDTLASAMSVTAYILTTSSAQVQAQYPLAVASTSRNLRLVATGRWF